MGRWFVEFKNLYPKTELDIVGGGSSIAPPALLEGRSQLAPMTRRMTSAEEEAFAARGGARPTAFTVAADALAIFVNRDNPVTRLTLQQVDAIFSSTRERGGAAVKTWGDLGLGGTWASVPIALYGFGASAGAYALFRESALGGGDFKAALKPQPGSSSVVQGPAANPGGIAYASVYFRTPRIRPVSLSAGEGPFLLPTQEHAVSGAYPLARVLYVYVLLGRDPLAPPAVLEFLRFMFSQEGQQIVAREGAYPFPAAIIESQLRMLGG
jgi:phosphate transport system substrate-binding protein